MDVESVHAEHNAASQPRTTDEALMRRWTRRRKQVEREQAAQKIVRAHDAAWRLRLLGTLGALLDALRRKRAA